MGEYKNTYQKIEMLKIRKIELIEQINELHEELYNIDIEIGECEEYFAELRDIMGRLANDKKWNDSNYFNDTFSIINLRSSCAPDTKIRWNLWRSWTGSFERVAAAHSRISKLYGQSMGLSIGFLVQY